MHRHPRVRFPVRDEQGHADLVCIVQRGDAFQKGSYDGVRLVTVFETSVCATYRGRVLEERYPVSDAKVGSATFELGGIMNQGGLLSDRSD